MKGYFAASRCAQSEFVEKKSRFITHVATVENATQAEAFIAEIKKKYPDARHNCWAYRVHDPFGERYSDDGEPQGTAGIPVLDVLQKEGLTDCCVVVTRYFGGILLGGGGLVRAYSHAAKLAVDSAEIIKMSMCVRAVCTCDYAFYGKLSSLIPECGGTVETSDFTDTVSVYFNIPEELYNSFCAQLTEASFGKVESSEIEKIFMINKNLKNQKDIYKIKTIT